jgi:aldose sugar dehydrogenase
MRRLLFVVLAACCATPVLAQTFPSSAGNLSVETVARGLANPWGLAFLPDGKMLVTERPGRKVIFRQEGPLSGGNHYGCRIVQGRDGNLWLTMGDHWAYRNEAQNLANHIGKIVRITPDGAGPPDNPFAGRSDAKPEIWSYGHRNSQGAALHPQSGKLWMHEHGPKGGDEVNIPLAGKNYGWPVIGYGVNYDGTKAHESSAKPGMEQPVKYWVPSIAPSGMAFYTADLFPAWKGSVFIGALAGQMLVRLSLDGENVTGEERLLERLGERIRDVRQGPDGALWLLADAGNGRVLRVTPAK